MHINDLGSKSSASAVTGNDAFSKIATLNTNLAGKASNAAVNARLPLAGGNLTGGITFNNGTNDSPEIIFASPAATHYIDLYEGSLRFFNGNGTHVTLTNDGRIFINQLYCNSQRVYPIKYEERTVTFDANGRCTITFSKQTQLVSFSAVSGNNLGEHHFSRINAHTGYLLENSLQKNKTIVIDLVYFEI